MNLPEPADVGRTGFNANGAELAHPYLFRLVFEPSRKGVSADLHPRAAPGILFLSNAVRLHRKLRKAAVATELHVFEAMPHGGFGGTEEDEEIAQEVGRFIRANVRGMPDRSAG